MKFSFENVLLTKIIIEPNDFSQSLIIFYLHNIKFFLNKNIFISRFLLLENNVHTFRITIVGYNLAFFHDLAFNT